MIRRKIFRKAARWLVVALLFAQVAVTANACLAASSARMEAVASAAHEGCDMQERNLNLCLYHCADQYNNESTAQVTIFVPALVALSEPARPGSATSPGEACTILGRATGPPIPIRYCCFRI